jgi:2-methylisocitrate lyase-like PEP mutase family enzyme
MQTKAARMRALLKEGIVVSPGIYDGLSARMVEKAGFKAASTGGSGFSNARIGQPDIGLLSMMENVDACRHLARSVAIPIMADAETGYGNPVTVFHAVQYFEEAGVVGMNIEDQVSPKRCGHAAGKLVVPLEEAVGKLQAALDARSDKDFVIIARTDAVAAAGGGLDEAIRRAKAFAAIGCDVIWAEFPSADLEYPRRFAQEVLREHPGVPLYLNYSANLEWADSKASFEDFADMGYKAMHVSLAGLRTSMQSMWDYAVDFKARGAQAEIDFQKRLAQHPMGAYHELAGFPKMRALEERYLPAEEVKKKYDGAVGL